MKNPFETIDLRLSLIEEVLLSIKNQSIPNLENMIEPSEPKIVDFKGLMKYRPQVGSESTIYKKVSQDVIPHSKRGKKLFFELGKIDKWLLGNEEDVTPKSNN